MAIHVRRIGTGNNVADVEYFKVAANQSIEFGDFVQINAATGLLTAAAAGSTTIVGIANGTIVTGSEGGEQELPVSLAKDAILRASFTDAGTKKTFTQADMYKGFDLANAKTVDPDETDGMMQVVGFDNDALTVDVVVKQEALYLK